MLKLCLPFAGSASWGAAAPYIVSFVALHILKEKTSIENIFLFCRDEVNSTEGTNLEKRKCALYDVKKWTKKFGDEII